VDYFDAGSASKINHAPLPKVDVSNEQFLVIPPQGLQYLEESIYSESPNVQTIMNECKKLHFTLVRTFKYVLLEEQMTEENLFLCVRSCLIRIATMGITGFDAPASGSSLRESAVAMNAVAMAYQLIQPETNGK